MPTPDRIKDILYEALDLPTHSRAAFLDRTCENDPELRAKVQTLLEAHEDAPGFMDGANTRSPLIEPIDIQPGDTLGPYRLVRQLGEGGFGAVFLAEQSEPLKRLVAIKILKPGMDTRHVIARFEQERQTLAIMDHPAIASVYDAGATPAGRPYVVMEFVDGQPVTEYCDDEGLDIPARLAIFERICAAVQHAHQKGVIHRDLKPSNVLIHELDGQPQPKIIDFGIAKAIADQRPDMSRLTHGRQLLGTPEYMSPEQATGATDSIDTRSDVYSLGVLLYELICGEPPFDRERLRTAGFIELERILREDVPPRPSTRLIALDAIRLDAIATRRATDPIRMPRALRGDLDWIAMRAIEKDPDRRYPSANALGADIRRHLNDQPVEAGPPNALYAASKLLRRHKPAAIAALLAALAIVGALIISNISLYRVNQANQQGTERLWASYLAQARATRQGIRPGRRFESLEAIAAAARIRPSLELRNEAVACFALADLRHESTWEDKPFPHSNGLREVDRYAYRSTPTTIRVASIHDDATIAELECPEQIAHLGMFSPDGRYLSIHFDAPHTRITWDLQSYDRVLVTAPGEYQYYGVAFGTDRLGDWQAHIDTDGNLRIHDLPSGNLRGQVPIGPGQNMITVSDDGATIAVSRYHTSTVSIVDVASRSIVHELEPPVKVWDIDFSADGSLLAGGGDDFRVYLWSTDDWSQHATLEGHQGVVVSVEFANEGAILATSGWDSAIWLWDAQAAVPVLGPLEGWGLSGFSDSLTAIRRGSISHWTFERGHDLTQIELPGPLNTFASIDFARDEQSVLIGGSAGIRLIDIATRAVAAIISEEPSMDAVFDEQGARILATQTDGLRAWTMQGHLPADEQLLLAQTGEKRFTRLKGSSTLSMTSPRGVTVLDDYTADELAHLGMYRGLTTRPSITPDLRVAFTGNWKGEGGRVRDFATGQTLLHIEASHVVGQFSPDGRFLVVTTGEQIQCFETKGWTTVWQHDRNNTDDLAGRVAFSRDGSIVAVGNSRYQLDLCRTATGEVVLSIESPGHQALGDSAFTPDSGKLAIVTTQSLAHIYDLKKMRDRLVALGLDWSDTPPARAAAGP